MLPLVTVIIPTYNYAVYILDAITSVLHQNYPKEKIEIVIVDDGSTDNTKEVLKDLIDDGTVHYYFQSNKGKASATAEAVMRSSGKYIFNLDADDYFFAKKIKTVVDIFEKYPDVVHVSAPANFVNQESGKTVTEQFPEDIVEHPLDGLLLLERFYDYHILYGGGSTYCARASVLKTIVVPNDVDMYTDEFLIMAILLYGKSFFLREPLSVWREHSANYSGGVNTKEKKIKKGERLLRSSAGMLRYVENHPFSNRIKRIYRLIDETRQMAHREMTGQKSLRDIIRYGRQIFFVIKPDWELIKKYHVLNRMIPQSIYKIAKGSKQ